MEKIFLGIDIGTNSVGWAVTDGDYKLKKFRNNLMWGTHLFDEANQAAERRTFRTARRRLARRKQRIELLQNIFAGDILKIDNNFFLRLKESALLPVDSEHRTHNIFFDDGEYSDKEYFEEYPTIHHLISDLIHNPCEHDVRLVYMACAYLLGHRGHFLFDVDKDNIEKINDFTEIYDSFYRALEELCETVPFECKSEEFSKLLKEQGSIKQREVNYFNLLFAGKRPKKDEFEIRFDLVIKLICGGTAKLSDLFRKDEYNELEKNSISVNKADFDDTLEELSAQIDETDYNLIFSIKAMSDWALLADIRRGHKIVSDAKKEIYDTHKEDLKTLKHIIRKYLQRKDYDEIFKNISDKPNYSSYVYNAPSSKPREKYKQCTQEDFCKFVLKYLQKISIDKEDEEVYNRITIKCADGSLCPKQVTPDNRVIPYQLYYAELKQILSNAKEYLPFLNESDKYGTVADKILKIMEFRIPYYVGPLVDWSKSDNAWLVRKSEGKIYPWNFDNMVDCDKTENEFIRRMTCKCSYLAGEDVLPKYSLLYCRYNVLNEINPIAIDGTAITAETKQKIYENLFLKRRRVTKKMIKNLLISMGEMDETQILTGIDDNVKSSLKSYLDFKQLLTSGQLSESEAENIIERITVTTDTKRLRMWLREKYTNLSEDDIKYLSKLNYNDYGRLSRTLLESIYEIDNKTGEVISNKSIINMLWETNENLMQLLSAKYGYITGIEHFNNLYYAIPENNKTLSERMEDMYLPSAVRRSVNRTLDIVKELKTILKKSPDRIFIEMARGGESETKKGNRTASRRKQLTDFLNSTDDESAEMLKSQLASLDDGQIRSEKYYLYFKQLGRCMYTGEPIPFENLSDNRKWDVDHIWPQSKIKDDSLDNKVLVKSEENGKKSDRYPIAADIRNRMHGFWVALRKKNLISEKKFNRLTRNTTFTDDELSGFIARQLVETRQSTKAVAELLKEICPESEIVYVKAGLVSEFRHEYEMVKCREINDLHHAKDAYLNIVMGNVHYVKFTRSPLNFIKSGETYSMNLHSLLSHCIERYGEIAWEPDLSFDLVRKMMSKNSIRYVRYAYRRKGGLFNQMPERKKDGLVPRKKGLDPVKYGGYNNTAASFFAAVKCKEKSVVIMPVELMYADKFLADEEFAKTYSAQQLSGILSDEIDRERISFPLGKRIIKINTMIDIDGLRLLISSKSNKGKVLGVVSATSLILPDRYYKYAKIITSYKSKSENGKKYSADMQESISSERNIELFNFICDKLQNAPFDAMFTTIGLKVSGGIEKFGQLSLTEQTLILCNIIHLLKTGRSTGCDLKLIGESANAGVLTLNSDFSKLKNKLSICIIDQSPTGLLEKKSANLLEL